MSKGGSNVYYDLEAKQWYTYPAYKDSFSAWKLGEKTFIPTPTMETIVTRTEIEEVSVPTMPVLAGFEKTITEQLGTLLEGIKGVAQPIIYTETPQGMELNWKTILPIGGVLLYLLLV